MSRQRLPIETFGIPVQRIRRGYYSAVYFWREKQILEQMDYARKVLMQVFQKNNAVLCGTDEAIAVLRICSGYYVNQTRAYNLFDRYLKLDQQIRRMMGSISERSSDLKSLLLNKVNLELELDSLWKRVDDEIQIASLLDGDQVEPWETVMTITGLPQYFAHLESVYLGILTRRTLVATNVSKVVQAACGKPILFFADRFDHYENQTGDGYAAMIGGAYGVATDIMGEWWGKKGAGTMPHALIACFLGDTPAATIKFASAYPEVPCISLVDFHNDCVETALNVAYAMRSEGLKLWGVRLDTSETMVDRSLIRNNQLGREKPTGVNPILVKNVRQALDRNGFQDVKIVVSGGFNEQKIDYFEKNKVPVDAYGCGSSLLKGSNDFTADIVMVHGKHRAKDGRWYRPNEKLQLVPIS